MGDEKQARHVLGVMQARLARSPYDALGIQGGDVGPNEVRAAFFALSKTYHPAKFARMSPEIQRLANEVFLALRAAHDQLARPRTAPVRETGRIPVLIATRETSRPMAVPRQSTPNVGLPVARPNQPPAPSAAVAPSTQRGVAAAASPQSSAQRTQPAPAARSGAHRRVTPVGGVPIPPSGPRPAVGARPPTPAIGVPRTPAAGSTEPELAGVYDMLQRGEWAAARTALNALIARQPRPRYRALLQYSIGREAQLARRLDEARVDLQAALEIDPDLQVAKTALAELFTRRR